MSSRTMLLMMTVALLVVGVYLVTQEGISATYAGGFIKAGLVTGALWLALPQLTAFFKQTPRWLLIGGGIGIAIATMNWQLLLLIVPAVAAMWFFAPRLLASAKSKILPTISAPPPGRRARRKREAE
jgi:hypothetical protein